MCEKQSREWNPSLGREQLIRKRSSIYSVETAESFVSLHPNMLKRWRRPWSYTHLMGPTARIYTLGNDTKEPKLICGPQTEVRIHMMSIAMVFPFSFAIGWYHIISYHLRMCRLFIRFDIMFVNARERKTYNNTTFQHLGESLLDGAGTDTGAVAVAVSISVSVSSSHLVLPCLFPCY